MASAGIQPQHQPQPQPQQVRVVRALLLNTCDNADKDEIFLLIPLYEVAQRVVGFRFSDNFYKMLYLRNIQCERDNRMTRTASDKFATRIFDLCMLTDEKEGNPEAFSAKLTQDIFNDNIYKQQGCRIKFQEDTVKAKVWKTFNDFYKFLHTRLIKMGVRDKETMKAQLKNAIDNIITRGLFDWIELNITRKRNNPELFNDYSQFFLKVQEWKSSCGEAGGKVSAEDRATRERMRGEEQGSPIKAHFLDAGIMGALNSWWKSISDKQYWLEQHWLPFPPEQRRQFLSQELNVEPSSPEVNYVMTLIDKEAVAHAASKQGGKRKKKTKKKRRRKKNSKKKGGRRKKSKKNRRKKKKSRRKRR